MAHRDSAWPQDETAVVWRCPPNNALHAFDCVHLQRSDRSRWCWYSSLDEAQQQNPELVPCGVCRGTPSHRPRYPARGMSSRHHVPQGRGGGAATDDELLRLVDACRAVPPAQRDYREHDFVTNLLLTVLDFQLQSTQVAGAIGHYRRSRWQGIRTLTDLEQTLARYPDDQEGNAAAAMHLWGGRYWTRLALLRRLTAFFRQTGVTSQERLRDWARTAEFSRDFAGKVPGLGLAVFQWLIIRQGVETVKPDVHLHGFVAHVLGKQLSDAELVDALTRAATALGLKAYELDFAIWEYQRGKPGA